MARLESRPPSCEAPPQIGYVDVNAVGGAAKPLRQVRLPEVTDVFERPLAPSPVVDTLERNSPVDVFGTFNGYELLRLSRGLTGWMAVEPTGTHGRSQLNRPW